MGFQNLGIGGTLTFNEDPALVGMSRASKGFSRMQASAMSFRSSFQQLGQEMDRFNLFGVGLAALGVVGFGGLIKGSIEAKSHFEDMQVQIATTLGITRKMGSDFTAQMALAADEMDKIEILAAKAPGETQDLVNIYKSIVGPLSRMGQSLEQVRDMTLGAAIAAPNLGISFEDMAFGMNKLISGQVEHHDQLFRQLHASMGLIKEDTAQWRALTDSKRLEKLTEIMGVFKARAGLVENTWSAISGTVLSIVKVMQRAFIGPVYDRMREVLGSLTDDFLKNMDMWKKRGEDAGKFLVPMLDLLIESLKELISDGKAVVRFFSELKSKAGDVLGFIGVTADGFHRFKVVALEVVLALGLVLPAFAILRTLAGPLGAALRLVSSGIMLVARSAMSFFPAMMGAFGGALLPVLLVIAAVLGTVGIGIANARKEGEGFTDVIKRWWNDYLKPFFSGISQGFSEWIPAIKAELSEAFYELRQAGLLMFGSFSSSLDASSLSWKDMGKIAGAVIGSIITGVAKIVHVFATVTGAIMFTVAHITWLFDVISTRISDVATLISTVLGINEAFGKLDFSSPASIMKTAADFRKDQSVKMFQQLADKAAAGSVWTALPESPGDLEIKRQREEAERGLLKKTDKAKAPPDLEVTVNDERCLHLDNKLSLDSREVTAAQMRENIDLKDRAGATAKPWQRQAVRTRGTEYAKR